MDIWHSIAIAIEYWVPNVNSVTILKSFGWTHHYRINDRTITYLKCHTPPIDRPEKINRGVSLDIWRYLQVIGYTYRDLHSNEIINASDRSELAQ